MAEREQANKTTKAGLMNKHANEVEPIEPEDVANEQIDANESGEGDSIDEKMPRAGKHQSEGSRQKEGLH